MQAKFSRREVLSATAAIGLAAVLPGERAAGGAEPRQLTARPTRSELLGVGRPATDVWTFDGTIPGPVLRVRQGEELAVTISNRLPVPTTVHWHGIRNDNRMDGVPGLTQDPIPPGGTFEYRFTPPDAGTFWYHPHQRSFEGVPRGLTGALIVEERQPPKADQDIVLVINDWRLDGDGRLIEPFGSRHDQAHAGRLGNHITVNGQPNATIPVRLNERVRLRLINACSARTLKLLLEGAAPELIALDGQPVGPTTSYGDALTLGPANRVDLMLDVTGPQGGRLALTDISDERQELAALLVHPSDRARAEPLIAPIALTPNRLAIPERSGALAVPLVMTGGATSEMDMSFLAGSGQVWQFNGVVDAASLTGICSANPPLFQVARGRTVLVRFENATAWPHAMHIHGHHFRLLERLNGPPPEPFWWDTLLVQPGETSLVAFVADNPGKWMLHCHMLDHQASGMESWFEVAT